MTERSMKLHRISDFEWASGARYILYVSRIAGLSEISSNAIFSFSVGERGPKALLAKKLKAERLIAENMRLLAVFVGDRTDDLGEDEVSIIRGMYSTWKEALEIVKSHVAVCNQVVSQLNLWQVEPDGAGYDVLL